nr:PEGA domain-containing protein [Myxococcota bacterium]
RRGSGRRRPPRPPTAAPATGPGTVIVSTPGGWANVYDSNGRFLGDTPLTITLPAGRHRLSLRPFGQPPSRSASVEVVSGETARVSQPL